MKELLKELIKKALEELNVEAEIEISKPALPENGDYSSNIAMKLAKVLKKKKDMVVQILVMVKK